MRAFVGHEEEQSTDALSTEDAIAMQKLRLNEAQWARVIAENDLRPTAQFTPRSDATPSSSSLQVAYVLSLEGAGFAKARRRWGFQGDASGHPPHFDSQQVAALERAGDTL